MQQALSAQIGLLAFGAAITAGLLAGNGPFTVLGRALVVMFAALLVAQVVTAITKRVLREDLQKRRFAIDREHLAASQSEPTDGSTQLSEPNGG